jgi:hypothetical protein
MGHSERHLEDRELGRPSSRFAPTGVAVTQHASIPEIAPPTRPLGSPMSLCCTSAPPLPPPISRQPDQRVTCARCRVAPSGTGRSGSLRRHRRAPRPRSRRATSATIQGRQPPTSRHQATTQTRRTSTSRPSSGCPEGTAGGPIPGVSRSSRPVGLDPGAGSRASVRFPHVPSGAGMVVLSAGDAVRYAPLTGPRDG